MTRQENGPPQPPGWFPMPTDLEPIEPEPLTGHPFPGEPFGGQTVPGQTVPDQPSSGQPYWEQQAARPPGPGRRTRMAVLVAVGVAVALSGLAVGAAIGSRRTPKRSSTFAPSPPAGGRAGPSPVPTIPAPAGPAATALAGLVVQQSDVDPSIAVIPLPQGNRVDGEVTLDVCNADYPSEQLRTNRLQVVARALDGGSGLSTEAVLYTNGAATAQAFSELKAAAANCPAGPVTSPVGEPTVATHFNPAPDAGWPSTASVERVAFDFVTTDGQGSTFHSVAVYLRRGRALLGIYFSQPEAPPAVSGRTDIPSIVQLFAGRMAALPASVVGS